MAISAICLSDDELGELTRMLRASGLPADDVREPGRTFFRLEDQVGLIGFGGWEGRGSERLLRSLVIASWRQRQGLGRLALAMIEEWACDAGAASLHLLTTTAASFFRANGYKDAERNTAPHSIRATNEFNFLCPASASYMVKELKHARSVS